MSVSATSQRGDTAGYDVVAASRAEFARVARSFWLIPEAIPPRQRDRVALLYCLCRHLDDAVDESSDAEQAATALACFRDELAETRPARPLVAAFLTAARDGGVPLEGVRHLLDGMGDDLGVVRLADDRSLLRYAYRVSAAVGLMLAPLLGVQGTEAMRRVVDLGLALQIDNVLLGVESDARRGRVYLPATRLRAAGMTHDHVLARPDDPRLRPVLGGLAALAARYTRSAEQGARQIPLRYRHGVLLLGRAYASLAARAARGLSAPAVPAALPLPFMLRELARLGAMALDPCTLGLRGPEPHERALHAALDPGWLGVHS